MGGGPCLSAEALRNTGVLRQACVSRTSSVRHCAVNLRRLCTDREASGRLHEIATVGRLGMPCGVRSTKPPAPRLRVPKPDLLRRGVWLFRLPSIKRKDMLPKQALGAYLARSCLYRMARLRHLLFFCASRRCISCLAQQEDRPSPNGRRPVGAHHVRFFHPR